MIPVPAATRTARLARWPGLIGMDLAAFGALALVSMLAGWLLNGLQRHPLPLWYQSRAERLHATVAGLAPVVPSKPVSPAAAKPGEIGLGEFQAFALVRKGVVIDARGSIFYGEGHVPSALNISREGFRADYQRLGPRLNIHKADAIAVYCSGADCHDADLVADALAGLGYEKLHIYREGWEEWSQSGLPQEK